MDKCALSLQEKQYCKNKWWNTLATVIGRVLTARIKPPLPFGQLKNAL